MGKLEIPARVIVPGDTARFVKQKNHSPTNSASLRYAALWALGARGYAPSASLVLLEEWCRQHHKECQLFPDPNGLESLSFVDRLRLKDCPEAAENVACYAGNKQRNTPSYTEVYHLVWKEQKWPELCKILSESNVHDAER